MLPILIKDWLPGTSVNISIDFHPFDTPFFYVSSMRDVRLFGTDMSDMTVLSTSLPQRIIFPGSYGDVLQISSGVIFGPGIDSNKATTCIKA